MPECARVPRRGFRGRLQLPAQSVDPVARDRHPGKERVPRHAEIALGIPRWNTAFVREEQVGRLPRKTATGGFSEAPVESERGASARDYEREAASLTHGGDRGGDEMTGEGRAGGIEIREDERPTV